MSTSVFTATGAACEVRYLRLGAGKPVVLLHPLRMQLEYFQPLINQLDTGRIEIIAVDLPGHGLSTAPRVDYTARFFTDADAPASIRPLSSLDRPGEVAKLIEGVLR